MRGVEGRLEAEETGVEAAHLLVFCLHNLQNNRFINRVEDEQLWGKRHHELHSVHLRICFSPQKSQGPVLQNT